MDLLQYIENSPSPAWAAENAAQQLLKAGFRDAAGGKITAGSDIFFRPHSGMLIAARMPAQLSDKAAAFRIIGAHTDSPHLRLKANAGIKKEDMLTLSVEVYGGALLYSWFDRELGIAGELYYGTAAGIEKKLIRANKALAIVPSLAIHLQRGVNEDGLIPDKAEGLNAILSLGEGSDTFTEWLAAEAGISASSILSYDLSLFDLAKPARGGLNNEFIYAARLDNLVSCHTAISALLSAKNTNAVTIAALFDHEEIGSVSEGGAASGITEAVLAEIAGAFAISGGMFREMLGRSVFLSADMAHGVHPHHAARHDSNATNRPRLGGGVTVKINQNRRYATSAQTEALFNDLCRRHNIRHQLYTHRNDLPCGSTIGPTLSAKIGIATLDVGVAMLGMHSIRETCAHSDLGEYEKFMLAFLTE